MVTTVFFGPDDGLIALTAGAGSGAGAGVGVVFVSFLQDTMNNMLHAAAITNGLIFIKNWFCLNGVYN
jgi:hypothetical protein